MSATVQHDDAWLRHPDRTPREIVDAHERGELADVLKTDAPPAIASQIVAAAHGPQE